MPSDILTIVSTGIGVSVCAGVISGVCYVLAYGFTNKRNLTSILQWKCNLCGSFFRSKFNKNTARNVICLMCHERVCRNGCSKRWKGGKEWICYNCLKQATEVRCVFSKIPLKSGMGKKIIESLDRKQQEEHDFVRDLIESSVSAIVGSHVDDVSIFRLCNDGQYEALFNKYHRQLSCAITKLSAALQLSIKNSTPDGQSPTTAHATLKRLIQKIISDVSNQPIFANRKNPLPNLENEEGDTYEQLLATAVINKIVSKNDSNDSNDQWQNKWKLLESTSASNNIQLLEESVDSVSFKIQQQLEHIPSSSLSSDINSDFCVSYYHDVDAYPSNNIISNWHLQKRQLTKNPVSGTRSPVPVAMLVPNSAMEAKVLIGDKEVDEASDFSDSNSLIDEMHFDVDGKIDFSDEDTSCDSGVREDQTDFNNEACETHADENIKDASLCSSNGNIEKDSEYLIQYSTVPRVTIESRARFGRDYYTKQAGLPSGRKKLSQQEINNNEDDFYKAETVTTIDDSFLFMDNHESDDNEFSLSELVSTPEVHENSFENTIEYIAPKVMTPSVYPSFIEWAIPSSKASVQPNTLEEKPVEACNRNIIKTSIQPKTFEEKPEETCNTNIVKKSSTVNDPGMTSKNVLNSPVYKATYFNNDHPDDVEVKVVPTLKRSDSTLIRKIYSNPLVRNFALSNRENNSHITDTIIKPKQTKETTLVPESMIGNKPIEKGPNLVLIDAKNTRPAVSSPHLSLEFSDNEITEGKKPESDEKAVINTLKKQQMVKTRLGLFSKSVPDVADITSQKNGVNKKEEISYSVKQLTRWFEAQNRK